MKKVIALVGILSILGLTPVYAASPAARPTSVAGCAKATSKVHDPAKLSQPTKPDAQLKKTMTISTNCGPIVIAFNPKAPQTVTNIAFLASKKYFDGTYCHRLTTSGLYVLQCGDPTGTGGGGPGGWKGYAEENLPKEGTNNYPAGTVAMANAGKGTNGSQFFLVYKDTTLPASYTIFGKITKGLDFIKKLEAVGAYTQNSTDGKYYYSNDGFPIQPVEIKKVTVS